MRTAANNNRPIPPPPGCQLTGTWWVDDRGKWRFLDRDSRDPHKRHPFGFDQTQERAVGYTFLGFAKCVIQDGQMLVEWSAEHVAPAALLSICRYLDRATHLQQFVLRYSYGGWMREVYPDPLQASRRIRRTTAFFQIPPLVRTSIHQMDLAQTRAGAKLIQLGMKAVQEISQSSAGNAAAILHNSGLSRSAVIFRTSPGDSQLAYAAVGADSAMAHTFGQQWAKTCIGRHFGNDPSHPNSTNRVCDPYEKALGSGAPSYDHVLAHFSEAGQEPYWLPYQRLLFSWRDAQGADCLASLCALTQHIATPLMAPLAAPAAIS